MLLEVDVLHLGLSAPGPRQRLPLTCEPVLTVLPDVSSHWGSLDDGDLAPLHIILTTAHKPEMISDLKVSVRTKQQTFGMKSLGFEFHLVRKPLFVCVCMCACFVGKRVREAGWLRVLNLFGFLHLCLDFCFVCSSLNTHFCSGADFLSTKTAVSVSLPASSQCLLIPQLPRNTGNPFPEPPIIPLTSQNKKCLWISMPPSGGAMSAPRDLAHLPGDAVVLM